MVQSVHRQIENEIDKAKSGTLYVVSDFATLGSAENIKKILLRLEQEGVLERIAHGIYLKPKVDRVLGVIYPTTEIIVKQIAKRDQARIAPTGVLALYLLGLTTQVPLKIVYLTDGSQREIKIGKRTIKLKNTAPKTFSIKDELLQLIVQALREIGQKNMTEDFLEKIEPAVQKLDKKTVEKQLAYAPVWVQKVVHKLYKPDNNVE